MTDLFVRSLQNRVRAMNALWDRAVQDLSPAQMNHHERAGVLPLAFSFTHYIKGQDETVSRYLLHEPPLWEQGLWAERTAVTIDAGGRQESVAVMEQLRIGDLPAWRDYQRQVLERTARALAGLTLDQFAEPVIPALPEHMRNTYAAIVVGGPGNPMRLLDVIECFVYQHGLRHMGEVQHGRALVGLGEMTS